jgi:ankyrin repeat protein
VREGHDKVARLLHANGARMFYAPEITSLRLSELAREGKLERMQTLVSFGCDVNAVDYDARTPLHAASGEGNVHILSYLLLQNADVNAVDHRGCTPLDEAVRTNHQLVAQRLREAGAQVRPSAFNRRILHPRSSPFRRPARSADGRGRAAR